MVRNVRRTADDATTLPFPVRSGGGGRRGAQTIDAATVGVPANGVTTGARDPRRPRPPNVEQRRNEDVGAGEAQASCAGASGGCANDDT